ncbi:MAG: class I SAM-dependent methyltransferase [Ignavibacteria bacterium]
MTKKKWFESWFSSQDYLDLYKHRDDVDAKKIVSLIFKHVLLKKKSKVLDLACGSGRHSVLFAKKGFYVRGIDLSKYLISQAKLNLDKEYKRYRSNLQFEIKDMRKFEYPGEFDLAVNIFTSFGYFENDRDNEKVIKCVSASLKKNGYFVLDFLNRYFLLKNLVPFDSAKEKGRLITQLRKIKDNFVVKDIVIIKKHRTKNIYRLFQEKIRLYTFQDFKRMFYKFGLKITNIFGDYYGNRFSKNISPRLIIFARKV